MPTQDRKLTSEASWETLCNNVTIDVVMHLFLAELDVMIKMMFKNVQLCLFYFYF